ncbi:extracellular solute-binding protein, partial [Candidatus Aerophobetes bacterium]|nr:extracellular solute-binding protein [Candidatus Aerophobetes bacterium]
MSVRKKSLALVGVMVGLLVVVPGLCLAQEKVELTFWHHEAPAHRVAAFQQAIDLFEKEYPDIKVNQEIVMWGDAWPKTLAAIEAGNPPDFQFGIPDLLLTVYRANAIVPLTNLVKEMDEKYQFFPGAIAPYHHENESWGVPIWTMAFLLTYRPSY